jgi:hypothetical protein
LFENRELREYLDLKWRKREEAGEECTVRSFVTHETDKKCI